jgi:hypothetical protein
VVSEAVYINAFMDVQIQKSRDVKYGERDDEACEPP